MKLKLDLTEKEKVQPKPKNKVNKDIANVTPNELPNVKNGTVREKKRWDKLKFWDKRNLKVKPDKSFLIKMFFSNGTCKEFVIVSSEETFDFQKRTYYLRYEDSWFNITQNLYELNYFDDYPIPIDRSVIRQGDKRLFSVSPDNLKPLLEMSYVKALASSTELDKYLKMNATLAVINVFIGLGILLMLWSGKG